MFDSDTAVFAANKAKRELAQEGRIGRTETRKPITYNGGADRVDVMGVMCAKVSDEVVDLNTVSRISAINAAGIAVTFEKDSLTLVNEVGIYYFVAGDFPVVFSFPADNIAGVPSGMYIPDTLDREDDTAFRVTRIEFTETIHPINPKYLPGAVLPVVIDLSAYRDENLSVADHFSDQIMRLALTGGGTYICESPTNLWDDASVENPLIFRLSYGSLDIFVHEPVLVIDSTTGDLLQICFSALIYHGEVGLLDIKVSINRILANNGSTINVKVS